ncbi:TIGR02265 family protein [Vitiosangium sp. GDMCC 1.1324]|uniref:TIGR02265 family protein n=1 Tax=Vitiosangium sp. (strain GDMCC 1.1324) TaxID=2138576 RepID=UPI000D360724|nr:TIGR02265 family protein [Vitiosangium sp. GDMCC 1.1324]PTL80558.1 TIGR02265 family protein [Vitiosangium sp. GDMCC 1.1324]
MSTDSAAARIKGSVLIARLKLLTKQGGAGRLHEVLQRLPPADRKVLEGVIMPIGWYPLELNLRLDAAIADVLSPKDRAKAFIDMGRASAEDNLNGPHHVFIRKGDPHFLLSHAPEIYRLYYAVGSRSYEKTGERSAVLRTVGAESVTEADCLTIIGWHQRAIELSGGRNVLVEHPKCRARGNGHCEYRCTWEA